MSQLNVSSASYFKYHEKIALLFALVVTLAVVLPFCIAQEKPTKMLRHVVMFKFRDDTSKENVQKVVDAFRSLKTSIPQVASFEYGTNNSPEGLSNGFTHCFFLTFRSEEDRKVYLPHPKHSEFVEILKPHLDKAQVLDYWATE